MSVETNTIGDKMIKLFKLVTGEEIIASFKDLGEGLELDIPVRIALTQQGIAMMPLSPFIKEGEKIIISKTNIVFTADVDDEVKNAYNSKFGSGIVIANSPLLLGD